METMDQTTPELACTVTTLTAKQRFDKCNQEIQTLQNLRGFAGAKIGAILLEVQSEKLYLEGYASFEEYCFVEWGYKKSYAYQLLSMGDFVAELEARAGINSAVADFEVPALPIPDNESQVRPLRRLPKDERAPAWLDAVAALPEGQKITTEYIAQFVERRNNGKLKLKELIDNSPHRAGKANPIQSTVDDDTQGEEGSELVERLLTDVAEEPTIEQERSVKFPSTPIGIGTTATHLKKPDTPFDIAIADASDFAGKASVAIDRLSIQLRKGGRLVLFCDPTDSYQMMAEGLSYGYTLEHSIVRPVEIDPEFKGDYLWPVSHQVILILQFSGDDREHRNSDRSVGRVIQSVGEVPGTIWDDSLPDCVDLILTAYCKPGDRLLAPTAGKHIIGQALLYGCNVTFLQSNPVKMAWYRSEFG